MPRLDSVCPIRALSLRMRMWQPIAISHPPPRAWPLIAATTGFGKRSMRRTTLLPNRMKLATSGPENALPRSAPAQKIRSPAPVMITDRTAASVSSSDSAAFSSRISASLIAFAGGRLSVITAKVSSRVRIKVSYAMRASPLLRIGGPRRGNALHEDIRDGIRGVREPVAPLAEDPRRRQLVHGAEQHLRRHLHGQIGSKAPCRDPLVEHGADQREVRGDLLASGPPEELLSLAQLELDDLGQVGVVLEDLEVQSHESPQLRHGVALLGDGSPQRAHEAGHLLAEQRDENLLLRVEVEIDRAGRDARLARDVGHARVEVALPGEHLDRGFDDLLRLIGIAHDRPLNRGSF